jgi:hypothetical protein
MAYGLQILSNTGTLVWDSTTVNGGLVVDLKEFAPGVSGGVFSYPNWAGHSAFLITNDSPSLVSLSTSSGMPVVTVANSSTEGREYALAVL